jgi:aryl-alcohol dehydrogenase-like predicted oxidoreductase
MTPPSPSTSLPTRRLGDSDLEVSVVGLAAQPAVGSVIAGATKPGQIAANVAALSWTPSAEDLAELDRIAPA